MWNYLRIRGMPEKANESTNNLVRQLAAEKLHVEQAESDIVRSHCVEKRSPNIKTKDIIGKFTIHDRKIDIMKNGKLLKGTNIFINN